MIQIQSPAKFLIAGSWFLLSFLSTLCWTLSFDSEHSQPLVQPSRKFLVSAMNSAWGCTFFPFFHRHKVNLFFKVAVVQLQGCKTCSALVDKFCHHMMYILMFADLKRSFLAKKTFSCGANLLVYCEIIYFL